MAKTTHIVRSARCCGCAQPGATRRCECGAFFCASCEPSWIPAHSQACSAVCAAQETAAIRSPTVEEDIALTTYVSICDFQLSMPPLVDESCPAVLATPPQSSGEGAAAFLSQQTEALEAVVDWLASQAPCLLHRDMADLLLSTAVRLRDEGQDAEVHLLSWAILDRAITAGIQPFQDALTLQHSSFSDWTVDMQQHSPRQVAGLPLVSKTAAAVLDMLGPVTVASHADQNPFCLSPLEIPPTCCGLLG